MVEAESRIALVYTVCASEAEALEISRVVVGAGLAACTNYWPIRSVYVWKDELVEDWEVAMLLKTTSNQLPALSDRVRGLHSYELPAWIEFDPEAIEPSYASWIRAGSSPSTAEHATGAEI